MLSLSAQDQLLHDAAIASEAQAALDALLDAVHARHAECKAGTSPGVPAT